MGTGASKGVRRTFDVLGGAILVLGLGVSLSGCPRAAPLENKGRFEELAPGPVDCNQTLPDGPTAVGCDYDSLIRKRCAAGGCHNRGTRSAGLDLTPDLLLIARILEEPAQHRIQCPGPVLCDLEMPQCADCSVCPDGAILLTKADFENSWIIEKMMAFNVDMPSTVQDMMCGDAMPLPPQNTGFTEEMRTCLTDFFRYIADTGRKCTIASGGSGGAGAGGAGAGSGGAGSGGVGGT